MNTSGAVKDVKQPTTPHSFVQHTETKISLSNDFADFPMKTGEIFRNNEGQYSFMCYHCGLIFEDFGEIINHCETHYQDEKYDISVQPSEFVLCSTETDCPEEIHADPPEMTSEEPILVSNESSNLANNSRVTVAVRRRNREKKGKVKNKSEKQKNENNPVPNFPQNCPVCEVWCDDFRHHMKSMHNFKGRVFQCYICKKFFSQIIALRNHILSSNHTETKCYHCAMEPPIKNPSEPRRHKCLFCKEWFANHIEFKIHFKDAHDKDADYFFHKRSNCNIFTCYICEREFPLRYYLTAHMKTHYDKFLQHQCPTCGRRVRTFGQLTQHLKTHEGRTFPCDQCDKVFPYYAKLRLHRFSHLTELNFQCDECPKAFKQRHYLKRHKAVHTNEKRYACKFCSASFNFTSGRRAHEKSQHKAL